ncbi:MAG: nucleoside kinase [Pseudobutyrivibrio ruminis]|uniref:Nucleoside kinase n=1 Tax=Pseudobutyrivibrio ruminis TaxID=46206 RepID=A0A927UC03_9FIRM|nr:nucleoside kinase [Pseudobutyrivibrio ruminis]MBE5919660.1 nucleoside kinase [Pseudobutyrivibrio ruminis]
MAKVIINGKEETYGDGTSLLEIAKRHKEDFRDDIVLAKYNGNLAELNKTVSEDASIEFLTTADKDGRRAYRRSVVFLLQRALMEVYPYPKHAYLRVQHSLGQGDFCTFDGVDEITTDKIEELKQVMHRLVKEDIPLKKYSIKTSEAREMFHKFNMVNKEQLLKYRTSSNINIYDLDGCKDYFYGYMVPSTGYLGYFDLLKFENGVMLMFPNGNKLTGDTRVVAEFSRPMKLFSVQQAASKFGETLGVSTVGELNEAITKGRIKDIVLSQEAIMERNIGELAHTIADRKDVKFVMMAGPSSSGKTTFSHKLSAQLRALGCVPHPVPLDDFYLNRDQMPIDEYGEKDFESIEGIDVPYFNECMVKLLNGERVLLPNFNFKTGKREYNDHYMQLGKNDILVIEGIHGLNDKMSESLPAESKYKIYLSALTQLSIDEHNPLSTTDGRLIRRIVRDSRTRATSAAETIAMWDSVRRGEEKYIFPFQEKADYLFNTALIYEMAVLKLYVDPQLYAIEPDHPMYAEAKRLIKLLDYFIPMAPDVIPNNSLVREFIGGSCIL